MQQIISSAIMRMTSIEIAELVGKRHDNVKRTIENLALSGVIKSPQAEEIPTATKPVMVYAFSGEKGKRDSIVVVAQLSPEFTARLVDRWQELESQQVKHTTPQISSHLEDDLRGIAFIADNLRVSDSGKLGMFTKYCQSNAPRLLPALPVYAIDAPIISGGESAASSEPTTTITNIVRPIGMSAAQANTHLEAMGLLERLTRKDSKGNPKPYWSVTEKGLAYGKNITSPSSPRETQPHWYLSKSIEIIGVIHMSKLV